MYTNGETEEGQTCVQDRTGKGGIVAELEVTDSEEKGYHEFWEIWKVTVSIPSKLCPEIPLYVRGICVVAVCSNQ